MEDMKPFCALDSAPKVSLDIPFIKLCFGAVGFRVEGYLLSYGPDPSLEEEGGMLEGSG